MLRAYHSKYNIDSKLYGDIDRFIRIVDWPSVYTVVLKQAGNQLLLNSLLPMAMQVISAI